MYRFFLLLGSVCLSAPVASGALVFHGTRSLWEDAVNLTGPFSEAVNGKRFIDFSVDCPTNGCPAFGQQNNYTSGLTGAQHGATMTMAAPFSSLNIQGFTSISSSSSYHRLFLMNANVSGYNWRIGSDPNPANWARVGWVQTRSTDTNPARMRVNMPTGTVGFGMEIALGCYLTLGCSDSENVPGLITLQTSNGETATLGNSTTQVFSDSSPTVGEFTFFGFTSDQPQVAWIDLTPSSPAAVVLARFTYASELTGPPGGGAIPEPAPAWLLAIGLGLLATPRLMQRR